MTDTTLPLASFRMEDMEALLLPTAPTLDGRAIQLGDTASLVFRDPAEADRATVTTTDEDGAATIAWPVLSSYVRLTLPADPITLALPLGGPIICAVELIATAATPVRADWLALLRREANGGLAYHQTVSDKPTLPNQPQVMRWQFTLRDQHRLAPHGTFLILQLPADATEFKLWRLSLRIIAASSPDHALRLEPGQIIAGQAGQGATLHLGAQFIAPTPHATLSPGPFARDLPTATDSDAETFAALESNGQLRAYLDLNAGPAAPRTLRRLARLADPAAPPAPEAEQAEAIAALKALHAAHETAALWRLTHRARLHEPDRAPTTRFHAQLLFLHARTHLEVNAAHTAAAAFARLLEPATAALLAPDDLRTARLLHARALLRSGHPEAGIAALDALRREHPTDWEPYFQLANALRVRDPVRRRTYLRAAETLQPQLPPPILTSLLMDLVEEGRADDALIRTLTALRADKPDPDLWLAFANIHLAGNDRASWQAALDRFYRSHALVPPLIDASLPPGAAIFACLAAPTVLPDPGDPTPSVTIAMTAFNAAATIEAAIRSVLAQSHRNLRLVVVDDASTDATPALLARLAQTDPRLTFLRNLRNLGTYASKNRVMAEATTDFIAFHDSDDWMHPEYLATHLARLAATPNALCATSHWFRMDARGQAMLLWPGGFLHENPASTLIRREVVARIGVFDSVRTGADSEFLWRMRRTFGRSAITDIRKPLAIGLQHGASLTQSGATAFDDNRHSPVRLRYWEAWVAWHREALLAGRDVVMPPGGERPFAAPLEILP